MAPSSSMNQARPWSGLTVVQNPSDQWPKWSCYIIALGLTIHFALKLNRYVGSARRNAATAAPQES